MNATTTITNSNQLPDFIRSIGGGSHFISLRTVTPVKMRKTNNPYLGTVKVAYRNGLVGVDHARRVNRRMEEAGVEPTKVAGTTWYSRDVDAKGNPLPLALHKTTQEPYLQFFPHRNISSHYELNGRRLTDAEVQVMQTFVSETSSKPFHEPVITLKMSSIRQIKFRKVQLSK